jgi:hypothetical protein
MRILLISILLACLSCSSKTEKMTVVSSKENLEKDTVVARIEVSNELAGSAYRKRAGSYFVINGSDTSSFKPIFSEVNDDESVSLSLNIPYSKSTFSYDQRLNELKRILTRATQDYPVNSLTTVSFGRLILSGDLAIELTKEYKERFGHNEKITTGQYKEISEFLLTSKLSKDLNQLFKPYQKSVKRIGIEKAFFTTKDELLTYSQITQDTSLIPERIIDFMTWIELE